MARHPVDQENRHGDPRYNKNAIIDRSQFHRQLFDAQGRPTRVMREFCGRMETEAGNLGPEGRMAWAETVFNRCASRGHTIDYELRNHGKYSYWPKHQSDPDAVHNKEYVDIISKVCNNGTNLTCGATGNASLGVGVGRETYRTKGERFGIESGDAGWWKNKFTGLIRGIGKFIGDVAGLVVKGVGEVFKFGARVVGAIFDPQHSHAGHGAPNVAGYHGPVNAPRMEDRPRSPELVHQAPKPTYSKWNINLASYSASQPAAKNDERSDIRPRPSH